MAKPKKQLSIRKVGNDLLVLHCLNPIEAMEELKKIEGLQEIIFYSESNVIHTWVNPLYDIDELIEEIKETLLEEIPESFKN